VTLLNLVRSQRKTTKVPSSPFSDATSLIGTYVGWVFGINATRLLNLVEHFPALEAATPKPDTPLANSQELSARVVAQRIVPFRSAVLRFIGPQARVVIQPPTNRERNKLIIDQILQCQLHLRLIWVHLSLKGSCPNSATQCTQNQLRR